MKQLHDLDWNLLKAFHFLMLERNVTKAAQRMGVTQSGLSHTLNRIREQLADPILVKTSEGMKATSVAESFHQQIKPIVLSLEISLTERSEFDPITSEKCFNILVTDYSERILSQFLLPLLEQQAPNVTINFISHHESSMAKLEQGEIHLMVGSYSGLPDSFRSKQLWQDRLVTLVNNQHPLAAKKSISAHEFCLYRHAFITKTGIGGGPVDNFLKQVGLSRKKVIYTRSFYNALNLLKHCDLISTLPERVAQSLVDRQALTVLSVEGIGTSLWSVDMVWPKICHQDKSQQWLRSVIKKASELIELTS